MDALTDLIALILSNIWIYGGSFILVLSVLVIVHEWGHYIVARICGVKVEEFAVGMGREIWGRTAADGTRWKVCLLPIGGYVKMFGDTDPAGAGKTDQVGEGEARRPMTADERNQAFFSKTVQQRAAIVFAGPAINFLFAIIVLSTLFITQGKQTTPSYVSAIHAGSAGEAAGLLPGDRIVSLDGKPAEGFDDLRRKVMLALNTPIKIEIQRGDATKVIVATPKRLETTDRFGFKHERGYLGVLGPSNGFDLKTITKVDGLETGKDADKTRALLLDRMGKGPFRISLDGVTDIDEVVINPIPDRNLDLKDPNAKNYNVLVPAQVLPKVYKKFGLFSAIIEASTQTWRISVDSLSALGQMVSGVRSPTELGGVIRIGTLAGDMAQEGVIALATFAALLSINLGLINLFPVPLLDGGHLAFYAVEAVRGKPVPDRMQEYAFRFGLVVLVFLMVFSNLNDILQLIL